ELREVLEVVKLRGAVLKVIVESGILTEAELRQCCALYGGFQVNFLKTSTGFAAQGATLEAVQIMRAALPAHIGIKAAGGIRSWAFAQQLIEAGATRIGCSASEQIMQEAEGQAEE
ncbi:MAG: 2-deoxyribose-5-phosphate aldolase, partial [Bacteroidetes bacterium]|nr:2-deoxyribose-5-phosphate aldolase [Bacteroidota bacterium]